VLLWSLLLLLTALTVRRLSSRNQPLVLLRLWHLVPAMPLRLKQSPQNLHRSCHLLKQQQQRTLLLQTQLLRDSLQLRALQPLLMQLQGPATVARQQELPLSLLCQVLQQQQQAKQ
jgi:hypothetical protein